MNVRTAIVEAAKRLAQASDTPRLDAELLMAALLGVSRGDMLLRRMADTVPSGWDEAIGRRMQHEPVAYILGHAEFRGLPFAVSPAVLIPRGDSNRDPVRALRHPEVISRAVVKACIAGWRVASAVGDLTAQP